MKKNEENKEIAVADLFTAEAKQFLEIAGIKGISDQEKQMFLKVCQIYGLNPFKREIYLSAYGQGENRQLSIITGFEVYLKRAEASGRLDGWSVETAGHGAEMVATVIIHRKDWAKPFKHSVNLPEYIQKNSEGRPTKFWATKPVTMLKKVAISQGFRMAFPEILGGMPYTADEMPDGEPVTVDIHHEMVENSPKNETKPELEPNSPEWGKAINYLKNGGKIDAVRTKYSIRDSERLLQEVATKG